MLNESDLVQTAQPVWVRLSDAGYEITDSDYSTRARVDLLALEILLVASTPCTGEQIATWIQDRYRPRGAVLARIEALRDDGFLVHARHAQKLELEPWWRRWGPEAHQLHQSCRRTHFLSAEDEVTAHKASLAAEAQAPTEVREAFVDRLPPRRAARFELPANYWDVIGQRRTAESHEGGSPRVDGLQALLSTTFAVTALEPTSGLGVAARKRYANAGGRHELVAYGLDFTIKEAPNASRYDDLRDELDTPAVRISRSEINEVTGCQGLADHANAAVVVLSDLDCGSWKYRGAAGYRTSLVNVGFAGQLLLQNATALGMSIRMTDSLDQDRLASLLQVTGGLLPMLVFTVSAR